MTDMDVKKLHITKCTNEQCLRSCLLKLSDASGSMKNHATLFMLFYFNHDELMDPNVNALGRAMRGGDLKKEPLDASKMQIIFGTIKKAYANTKSVHDFQKSNEWSNCIKAMNSKLNLIRSKKV